MKKEYVDTDYMVSIMKGLTPEQQKLYMNLYKNYILFYSNYGLPKQTIDSLDPIDMGTKKKIRKLEDKVYTINGIVLTEKERIVLELKNISRFVEKNGSSISEETKSIVLTEMQVLNSTIAEKGYLDNDMINYLKKSISILHAYLGMKIKFFNAALEAFDDQILMSRVNTNKKG